MRNLRLKIEYDGTNYAGWQIQNGLRLKSIGCQKKTLQGVMERVLKEIFKDDIRLVASGRTDAGVHALGQAANFKTDSRINLDNLKKAFNGLLPDDIAVKKIEEVGLDFHSRFNACSKIYRYTILNRDYPAPLLRNTVYFCPHPLDVNLMRREAKILLGRHDFKAFQGRASKKNGSVRHIKTLKIIKKDDLLYIDMEANGFLYNMARIIAGTLIELGRGKFSAGSMRRILYSRNRRLAGPTAPAHGLCLVKVNY
ncbi:MAG: tRNA pseudouridine(38-40) synthase TruA [Candidatus Omnitrophota bacterium]